MKPIHIGYGNFDESKYVYGYCKCPLPTDWAITFDRILDGKQHIYSCVCEDCGTEVNIFKEDRYSMDMDKLCELKAEIKGIKKIIDYCQKWQKRIEHQLEDDIWSENAEEDLDIISEMVGFCHKRLDKIKEEVNENE